MTMTLSPMWPYKAGSVVTATAAARSKPTVFFLADTPDADDPRGQTWICADGAGRYQRRELTLVHVLRDAGRFAPAEDPDTRERLWQAVENHAKAIREQGNLRPGMRTAMMIGSAGQTVSALYEFDDGEGSTVACHVQASIGPHEREPRVHHRRYSHNSESFWDSQLADRAGAVVVDHRHYRIAPDLPDSQRDMAGHGGSLFRIRFLDDGRVVESRNVWYQGVIPPTYRDRLPDTAEFVPAEVTSVALTGGE